MSDASPGVRRLCICVSAPEPGFLQVACRVRGASHLYTEHLSAEGLDLGFASPGVDEAALVTDLIAALRAVAVRQPAPAGGPHGSALAMFHVGVTRVEGDRLRGTAVTRARELLGELAGAVAPSGHALAVGVSAGLFEDIRAECGFGDGWTRLASAGAWFHGFGPGGATGLALS
jgi:hypothetical protein